MYLRERTTLGTVEAAEVVEHMLAMIMSLLWNDTFQQSHQDLP